MNEGRITQADAEAYVSGTTGNARITQDDAEVLVTGQNSNLRVTQVDAEVLVTGQNSNLRVTQVMAEVRYSFTSSGVPPVPPITPAPVGSRARVSNHPRPFRSGV